MKKYSINILVILFLLTPFTLFANGCHANNDTIKVLAIGNSFSQDAVEQYLHELGEAEGITMIIGNMFIGGCSLDGGKGSILGVFIGAAILGVIKNGFVLLRIPASWQSITIGIVIILACILDQMNHKKK